MSNISINIQQESEYSLKNPNSLLPEGVLIEHRILEYKLLFHNEESFMDLAIIKLKGDYPKGSQGAPVAKYASAIRAFLIEYYNLDCVVFDLQNLNYEWGNNLSELLFPENLKLKNDSWFFGFYLLCSNQNLKAVKNLFKSFGLKNDGIQTSYEAILIDLKKKALKKMII